MSLGSVPGPSFSDKNQTRKEADNLRLLTIAPNIRTINIQFQSKELIANLDVKVSASRPGYLVLKEECRGYESQVVKSFIALDEAIDNIKTPIDMF